MKTFTKFICVAFAILCFTSCAPGEEGPSIKKDGRSHLKGRWLLSYSITASIFETGTNEFQFLDHGVIHALNDDTPLIAKYQMGGYNLSKNRKKLKISFVTPQPLIIEIQHDTPDNFGGLLFLGKDSKSVGNISFSRVKGKPDLNGDFLYE